MSTSDVELVSEAELRELFRPRRVDPAQFRARVASRIAEQEREHGSESDRSTLRAELVRRAAAFVPLDPTGAAGGAKLVLASLALPFLVLVAAVSVLVASARSVRRSSSSARRAEVEPRFVLPIALAPTAKLRRGRALVQSLQVAGMFVLLLPSLTGAAWAVDIVVALVLVAAGTLAYLVRGMAEEALLTPRSVATCSTSILGGLFLGGFLWPLSRRAAESGSDLGAGWSAGVLLGGIVLCALLPRVRPALNSIGWLVLVPILLLLNPLGLTRSSTASLREQIATLELDARELRGWEPVDLAGGAVAEIDGSAIEPGSIEREIERALRGGFDAHPRVWTAAAHLGLMTRERWSALASRPLQKLRLDQLVELDMPLRMPVYDEYLVPMLLATRELTLEQREKLAARIDAAWPSTSSYDPLADALLRLRLFDHLGLAARVESRRADVHALLQDHWLPPGGSRMFAKRGGFTSDPAQFQSSVLGSTHAAVRLMARFGVPDGIDLRAVRGYLRGESAAHWLVFPEPAWLKLEARAALAQLEREIGVPRRALAAAIVGERVLIACVLLVLLCLFAIRAAPAPRSSDGPGALP